MEWTKRVIVVDDDLSCRNLFIDVLTYAGYDVVSLATVQDAFEQIKESMPDLVICDMLFNSKLEGLLLINQLQQDRYTRTIPVILCSAAIELARTRIPAPEQSGIQLLPKPFELDALYDQLAEAFA